MDLLLGSVRIPFGEIVEIITGGESQREEWTTIVKEIRMPKAIGGSFAGMALSLGGLLMQTIFRNPLAGPYVLGISAGAGLGVALVVLGTSSLFAITFVGFVGNWAVVLSAWLGAAFVLLLILFVSFRVKDVLTILVLGILFGSAIGAIVTILQFFSEAANLKTFVIWTMGSLGGITQKQLTVMIPGVLSGVLLAMFSAKKLNILLLGENYAKSLGLNILKARVLVFISTCLLAGTVTAFCGPIAFLGVTVPHISRMIFRTANHNILIYACMLVGGILMLLSDIVSQLPGTHSTLPINSVTALIGIPVIIWIIVRNQKLVHSN